MGGTYEPPWRKEGGSRREASGYRSASWACRSAVTWPLPLQAPALLPARRWSSSVRRGHLWCMLCLLKIALRFCPCFVLCCNSIVRQLFIHTLLSRLLSCPAPFSTFSVCCHRMLRHSSRGTSIAHARSSSPGRLPVTCRSGPRTPMPSLTVVGSTTGMPSSLVPSPCLPLFSSPPLGLFPRTEDALSLSGPIVHFTACLFL